MITLLPTPLGNLGDVTIRSLKLLQEADLILAEDTRVAKKLLDLLKNEYQIKLKPNLEIISFFEHNQKKRIQELEYRLMSENVVFMSDAGMPAISDPGQILIEFAQKKGIAYDVLPGASVVPLIYAASGFESGKFIFYGFLPRKGVQREKELQKVMQMEYDVILYEAPHRLLQLLESISKIDPKRELFLGKELTKRYQSYYKGSAKELFESLQNEKIMGEWAVIIHGSLQIKQQNMLTIDDIKALDLPIKQKAKLLAKMSGINAKKWYEKLLNA